MATPTKSATSQAKPSGASSQKTGSNGFDRFFEISKRGSTWLTEVRGGLVIFMTMVYILILNPIILSSSADVAGNNLSFTGVASATALTAGVMSLLFGLIARLPFALAAGLGINNFLAVTVVQGVTWPEAMGLIVIDGIIIVILAITGLRTMIFNAVPPALKTAITVGIGLFIAFIGLVDGGFVRRMPDAANTTVPVNFGIDAEHLVSIPSLTFVLGVVLIAVLMALRVRAAILIGLVVMTIVAIIFESTLHIGPQFSADGYNPFGWNLTVPGMPESVVGLPDFSTVRQVDLFGSFGRLGALAGIMLVFTLVFSNFFDAMGTMTGLSKQAGLADKKGHFPRLRSALVVEGAGAIAGGLTSTSSNTVYIESASGIGGGARTGFASVVTGALFLLAMFFTPLTTIVPVEVGASALVIVGGLMMAQVVDIDWKDWTISFPAFVAIILMPLTYSIANGIGAGFILWVILRSFAGKAKEIHWLLWVVAAGFLLYFIMPYIQQAVAG